MKYLLLTTIAALLLIGCVSLKPVEGNSAFNDAPEAGWIQLFNGRNFDGWRENKFKHKPEWKVIDGVLTGHGGQG